MGQILLFYTIVLGALFAICVQGRVLTSDEAKHTGILEQSLNGTNLDLRFRLISNHTEDGSLIVLSASFALRVQARVLTSDEVKPTEMVEQSLNGKNSGLIFRPISNRTEDDSLIWYDARNSTSIREWTELLGEYLEVYKKPGLTPGRGQNIYNCDYDRKPRPGGVCDVDVRHWYPCTQENNFNFHKSAPCIFLTLNMISDWEPEFYNDTKTLPEEMPTSLTNYIESMAANPDYRIRLDTIWVSCEGESPADVENIGPIDYYPERGFPGYFYPHMNSEGYLSPLIAVHFKRPRTGILINVECKAWAKNIIHSKADRLGSVHFELMID